MSACRILSEYLGVDQMLAVVARSFEAATHLETYTQMSEVDRSNALHAENEHRIWFSEY